MCLNRRSQTNPAVVENGVFCVNTLGADAEVIADMFAGRTGAQSEARFQLGSWGTLTTGAPVLTTSVVALDCRIIEIKAVASHNVIFGAIEAIHMGPAGPALVYHERAYKRV
jgi:flavin reductase (DIM6/NTAB) family NADH-FMN oxidoreductase RutF